VAVAGGVCGALVHPAKTRSKVSRERTRSRVSFFIPCCSTPPYIFVAKFPIQGVPPHPSYSIDQVGHFTLYSSIEKKVLMSEEMGRSYH
jgi:hypothetical protein